MKFKSSDKCLSGVPLGGIGAGKLEILPSGVWNAFTFLNNWSAPVAETGSYPGVLGYHLGLSVKRAGKRRCFLLQTAPVMDLPLVKSIRYEGRFPEAVLTFEDPRLGVEVSLRAAGTFVPYNADISALPGARFTLSVRNPAKSPVEVSLLFIGRNVLGDWNVGRRNRVSETAQWLHLDFSHTDPAPRSARSGRLLFSFAKKGWETSFLECWNGIRTNFKFDERNVRLDAWEEFAASGSLPNRRNSAEASGESYEWCSAVSARAVLPAGKTREWFWTAAWQAPNALEPARHEKLWRKPEQAHAVLVSRRREFERAVRMFHRAVRSFPFPEWFNDALINSLYPFFSASRYLKDGRFAFYEAPVICPLTGTLDVGFYGSIPLAWFFPDLSKSQLLQFARHQRPSGYLPHDLGRDRLDRPSDGTTPFFWKDLIPKYTLMVYRDVLWSGDRRFLRDVYPAVRRAMEWEAGTDRDGDGLPDHEGADQTFDLWEKRGAHAYTSGIYLAALLAAQRMAGQLRDAAAERLYAERFRAGAFSFDRKLWKGRFFGPTCGLGQLAGQWYADLLGLGSIAEDRKIRIAIETLRVWNARPTRMGWVNSTLPGGLPDDSNQHARNLWSGVNYAFVSLAVLRGYSPNKLLKPLERLWDNLIRRQSNPWNQPDTVDAVSGKFCFGDSYYRNMAIWSIPIGWARRNAPTARVLGHLKRAFGKVHT